MVRGPYRRASGHDHHVREFVRHLARQGIRQQLIDVPEWGPSRLPEGARDPWFDTLHAPVAATAAVHFCMPHQVKPVADLLTVMLGWEPSIPLRAGMERTYRWIYDEIKSGRSKDAPVNRP